MGDPAGIGPELALQLLAHSPLHQKSVPLLFGSHGLLQRVNEKLKITDNYSVLSLSEWRRQTTRPTHPTLVDCEVPDLENLSPGEISSSAGRAAATYLNEAISDALDQRIDAIVTCPLNKESLHAAGIPHPGHTEILAERTQAKHHTMMLTSSELSCSLVTIHVPCQQVPSLLTSENIVRTVQNTRLVIEQINQKKAKIGVLGLNPHAGENGLFGNEEAEIIAPAIARCREAGIDAEGPLCPDTAFIKPKRERYDAYVCMYHDQGLIPLKTLSFDTGVNVTLGLPITRTSVDHGTAFDIAWQGIASPQSLYEAYRLAVLLA